MDESSLTLSGFQAPASQQLCLLAHAQPPRRDLLPVYASSIASPLICPEPETAEPAPACLGCSVCRRDVPRLLMELLTPNLPAPWDLETCTPGEGWGARSKGRSREPQNRESSAFGSVEATACSPGERAPKAFHFGAGRRRSQAFTLSTLTADVSFLSVLCKYLFLS